MYNNIKVSQSRKKLENILRYFYIHGNPSGFLNKFKTSRRIVILITSQLLFGRIFDVKLKKYRELDGRHALAVMYTLVCVKVFTYQYKDHDLEYLLNYYLNEVNKYLNNSKNILQYIENNMKDCVTSNMTDNVKNNIIDNKLDYDNANSLTMENIKIYINVALLFNIIKKKSDIIYIKNYLITHFPEFNDILYQYKKDDDIVDLLSEIDYPNSITVKHFIFSFDTCTNNHNYYHKYYHKNDNIMKCKEDKSNLVNQKYITLDNSSQ